MTDEGNPYQIRDTIEPGESATDHAGWECPKCGCRRFALMKPRRLIAFTKDQVCHRCFHRVIVHPPTWASLVFVAIGILLVATGGIITFLSPFPVAQNPIAVLLLSTGFLTAWFGAGTLFTKVERIYSMPFFKLINDLLEHYFMFCIGVGSILLLTIFLSFFFFR